MSLRPLLICSCLWALFLHLIRRSLWPEGRESLRALSIVVGMLSAISITAPRIVSPAPWGIFLVVLQSCDELRWLCEGAVNTVTYLLQSVSLSWPHPINQVLPPLCLAQILSVAPWEVPGPCGQGSLFTLCWGLFPGHALPCRYHSPVGAPPKAKVFVNECGCPWKAALMKDAGRHVLTIWATIFGYLVNIFISFLKNENTHRK